MIGTRNFRMLVVGVGGQGVLAAARVIGEAARTADLPVRLGQAHGMAQRGGVVEGTVVIGPGETAFVGPGQADLVLGLEPFEVRRAIPRMHAHTRVLVNRQPVSLPVLTRAGEEYPDVDTILDPVRAVTNEAVVLDCLDVALKAGGVRTLNIVMIGALLGLDWLPFDASVLEQSLETRGPPRFWVRNKDALERGIRMGAELAQVRGRG